MNGKLVIRVGGGFMIIEEFIATYADAEMKKINAMEAASASDDVGSGRNSGKGYNSTRKSPRAANAGSPRNDTFGKKIS